MKSGYRKYMRLVSALMLVIASSGYGSNPYRGLWVGQAHLNYVNEVSVSLDENNVAIAPDPNTPTATADQAQIRLILHVNGAGQVNLLKDVAILKRENESATNGYYASEVEYALVTDDRLYSDFQSQEAKRIASAVFEFGDIKASEAVDAVVKATSEAVAASVKLSIDKHAAKTNAVAAIQPILDHADVADSFNTFLTTYLSKTQVDGYAVSPSGISTLRDTEATPLAQRAPYYDGRAVAVLNALDAAIAAAGTPEEKTAAAQNAVARFADVDNLYERFIHGNEFGYMIQSAALTADSLASVSNVTRQAIDSAVRGTAAYRAAATGALNAKVSAYEDTAATLAVDSVVSNMVDAAYVASTNLPVSSDLVAILEEVGIAALTSLQHAAISSDVPSSDYTAFVRSDAFQNVSQAVALAAAEAAVFETTQDPFYTESSLEGKARIAATLALTGLYSEAARAHKTELPLIGTFELGSGDARLISAISNTDAALGSAGLSGTIVLPANHPTNPFRHRRHPDHTVGFNITRHLRFDFDGVSTNSLEKTGLGVDRITGIFREEIHGLHKPLGPNPSTAPIGLKVEGPFELSRISLIDTLNAR